MGESKFCKGCGNKLNILTGILGAMTKKNYFEFDDGFYCEKCAKIRVAKRRKKL